jgi:drug/metabolite transporter (DMT)-like permease
MTLGILYALVAGLIWGMVFVAPLWLPDYPAALLAVGRYLAFGLIALPLAWLDRTRLKQLKRADWIEALVLSLVGNLLYYIALAAAIQRAGAPVPTMIIGTLPVVIAITSNLVNGEVDRLPWRRLAPSLLLIAAGIACVNQVELEHLRSQQGNAATARSTNDYLIGIAFAVIALVCWTIYPVRNARWLRHHRDRSPAAWATAQGLTTLPLALVGYGLLWGWFAWRGDAFAMPFGPRPEAFVPIVVAIGLLASWVGTLCWNESSQRLPSALSGQLIVFETLAALAYALILRGSAPPPLTLVGAGLLVAGVVWALRPSRPVAAASV